MKISLRFLPVILFFVFYGLIQVSFTSLRDDQLKEDAKENSVIQEIAIDRFKRYLDLPYILGYLGSQTRATGTISFEESDRYTKSIIETNPEFLGFNVLDEKGMIIHTAPADTNAKAQGRISQNLGLLMESYNNNKPFYLSPPFRLFQGQLGFVFYFPIKANGKLKGWNCVVISSESFLQKFSLDKFLRLFDIVIVDEESGRDYFATSIPPEDHTKVLSKTVEIMGRKMIFKSWRKSESFIYSYPWYFSVIIAFLLALASAFMQKLYGQKKKAKEQLDNISLLLRVTSKEALSNLIEIHSDLNRMKLPPDADVERFSRDINYLTNLIEQIDLLQTMAHSKEGLSESGLNFIQLIRQQLDNFHDALLRKKIRTQFDEKEFQNIVIHMNDWLFENSVLSNVFSHLLIHAEEGSTLVIENHSKPNCEIVKFRVKRQDSGEQAKILGRRMEVARRVLQLHNGEIREEINSNDEIVISIICNC